MTDAERYQAFVDGKSQLGGRSGFSPVWMPDFLFDFQQSLAEWSLEKGRGATFIDCGMGKTIIQLVWAENVGRFTDRPVLVITPLAVSPQTVREGEKFGIETRRERAGILKHGVLKKKHADRIVVTNYERLHYFNPQDFAGVVCDESSILKMFGGETQKVVTDFMRTVPYRLLCTATAAPNDYIELLTSAEALSELGRMDALSMFFKNDENSLHPIWWGARWRFKQHAELQFWRWICSWARTGRKPSDLGPFDDARFVLPPLEVLETVVQRKEPLAGFLFPMPAVTLAEQREERRATLQERCEMVASKVADTNDFAVCWCHLNPEGDLIEKLVPGAKQVCGAKSDEENEETFRAFSEGQLRVLVPKDSMGCFGMNFQHCNHMTTFPSHSWERYFQTVRRFYRFGQKRKVTVDVITTEGEMGVMKNLQRKEAAATKMFDMLVAEMNAAMGIQRTNDRVNPVEVPAWV